MQRAGKSFLVLAGILLAAFVFLENRSEWLPDYKADQVVKKSILAGSTFSVLAREAGVATATVSEILDKTKPIYDLSEISAGKEMAFVYDGESGELKGLHYDIDSENQLRIEDIATSTDSIWQAEKIPIAYEVRVDKVSGKIENSLYETIVSQGLDERLALALAEMFAWQIDFAAQIQKGDSFKVIYEKKYRDDIYSHPGKILAAEFINSSEKFQGFYFSSYGKDGYYDENGNSLQKVFLKAPLQYKYISSGFSYRRFNPILKQFTAHRGIDYAAPQGTPAVTVGDGTVVQAGWNGYYGISVKVRHNETYSTVYGHFTSIAKGIKVGARVKQGQIVGYVGSTGLSTGPHLHYEMHKFGSLINPFREKIPAGEPIREGDLEKFEELKKKYLEELTKI